MKKLIVVLVLVMVATLLSGCAFELPFKVPFVGKLVKKVDPNAPSVVPGLTNQQMKELAKLSEEIARAAADRTLFTETDRYREHLGVVPYRAFKKRGKRIKNELVPQKIKVGKALFIKSMNGADRNPTRQGAVYVAVPTREDEKDIVYGMGWLLEKDENGKKVWKLATLLPISKSEWDKLPKEFYNK